MANTKTKAVLALGLLDLARQATRGWAAAQQAERDLPRRRASRALRSGAASLAERANSIRSDYRPAIGVPPWRRAPTLGSRLAHLLPIGAILFAASAAVVATARWVAKHEPDREADAVVSDSRVVGVVRASSRAIDAGVEKLVHGGEGVAVGTASAVAAGTSVAKTAVAARAKHELDDRVVRPAKRKAITYGSLGALGLTLYIVVIAALVQLVVSWLG